VPPGQASIEAHFPLKRQASFWTRAGTLGGAGGESGVSFSSAYRKMEHGEQIDSELPALPAPPRQVKG